MARKLSPRLLLIAALSVGPALALTVWLQSRSAGPLAGVPAEGWPFANKYLDEEARFRALLEEERRLFMEEEAKRAGLGATMEERARQLEEAHRRLSADLERAKTAQREAQERVDALREAYARATEEAAEKAKDAPTDGR